MYTCMFLCMPVCRNQWYVCRYRCITVSVWWLAASRSRSGVLRVCFRVEASTPPQHCKPSTMKSKLVIRLLVDTR